MKRRIAMLVVVSACSIFARAEGHIGFPCQRSPHGGYSIDIVDAQGVEFNLKFVTAAQCEEESARLADVHLDRSKLPVMVCGCGFELQPIYSMYFTGNVQKWSLKCYMILSNGQISGETKYSETFKWSDGAKVCEKARLSLSDPPPYKPNNRF